MEGTLRLREKGGKQRIIPAARISPGGSSPGARRRGSRRPTRPLFQGVAGARGPGERATGRPLSSNAARAQLKRRLWTAGLPGSLRPHSFRVLVVTDLLEQGVPLEDVQTLVGHSQPQTTALYDRRERRIARSLVERISI